ncbi:MAG: tripartite tricarboxylate transporter substrate binding protein [Boseongicola sp. SB0662_bin_57]|nr:tripartite tricarboxylate transporter substrate binding protein [Boseongicola sp. SB0662_bin_57]
MRITRSLALAAAFVAAPFAVQAQDDFPSKPIEVVIHSSYGGGTDTTARMMMIRSRRNLETDMYVVSKRGGSGAAAQEYVLSRPADGYTIMALTQTHLYTIAQGKSPMKIDDIVGIARAMDDPTFITVRSDSDVASLEQLVVLGKERGLNWGVANIGGTEHIGLAKFSDAADMKYKPISFGSGLQMLQALLSGEIDATLPNVSEAGQMIADGSVRPLAVMAEERLADYPDVPTTFELGYPVKTSTTRGYAVRAGTPPEIIEKLSEALVKAMKHSTFANYLMSAGLDPETSPAGWEVWDKQLKAEYETAAEALKKLAN